jgi:hypothetical protein
MNRAAFLCVFVILPAGMSMQATTNPLSKTIELLDSLTAKITAEGKAEAKAYEEYVQWCDDSAGNLKYDIKSGEAKKEDLSATITKTTADIQASDGRIEDLASSISNDEQELKEATSVRDKEAADFAASEAELVDAIDTLDRAIMVLQREMRKNPAALAQVDSSNIDKLLKTLNTVINAAAFPVTDQKKLTALVQAQQGSDADDDDLGAPSTAAYKSHSTNIFDMLEDLKEKAEGQLSDLRKAESNTKHNFQMLRVSLEDQIEADTKDSNEEKASKAATQEAKSVAEGDLVETTKNLQNDKSALESASTTCTTVALDHDASLKSRQEELTALATARKILSESASGAEVQSYSFLQTHHSSELQTRVDLANAEIISLLKKLARDNHSTALAQLASRIAATLRFGAAAGEDPFAKVKQLITDLLNKLQAEAKEDATEKGYCDDEIAKSEEKKSELNAEITKLTTKMDSAAAASARLKADVKELQSTLAKLAKSQAEMDVIRQESHKDYVKAKADLTLGLEGVRKAVGVLRDYYGGAAAASAAMLQGSSDFNAMMEQPATPEYHGKAGSAGSSIISMLEVVESDFAKDLATEETAEADAEAEYQKSTQTNKVTKTMKEQDVKYKTKEFNSLDKTLSDLAGDKSTSGAELDAVMEYFAKIRERCIAKPEKYETRKARREAELAGLREALQILEGEAVFTQRGKKHGHQSSFLAAL